MNEKSPYIGTWMVQNPDSGEALPDLQSRIMTGGVYSFLGNRYVNISLSFRLQDGSQAEEEWVGKYLDMSEGRVKIDFIGGHEEIFASKETSRLERVSTTRNVIESEVVLIRVVE